jgi:hypothetical protein
LQLICIGQTSETKKRRERGEEREEERERRRERRIEEREEIHGKQQHQC